MEDRIIIGRTPAGRPIYEDSPRAANIKAAEEKRKIAEKIRLAEEKRINSETDIRLPVNNVIKINQFERELSREERIKKSLNRVNEIYKEITDITRNSITKEKK